MPDQLSQPQRRVLDALGTLHYATNRQLCRFLYSPASLTFVRDQTRALEAMGYVARDAKATKTFGNKDAIFSLSPTGRRLLAAEGWTHLAQIKLTADHFGLYQHHMLGITDIIVSAKHLERHDPARIVLLEAIHDIDLKRAPMRLTVQDRSVNFIPDAWLRFAVDGIPFPMCVELDRGTEEEKKWRQKVRCLLAFAQGPVTERFGVRNFTIVVPVRPGDMRIAAHRCDQLIRWTERELTERQMARWGQIFLFRPVDTATVSPADFFAAPAWRTPFSEGAHRLIEGYDRSGA